MAPSTLKSLMGSIRRKPATSPDNQTNGEAGVGHEKKTSITHDLLHGGAKNAHFVATALTTLASGEPLDDKELLLEKGVAMLQSFPPNSGLSSTISDGFIKMLWSDLPHPSATISGPTTKYRRADGGNNNVWNPEMGKAGSPYCRNVPPLKPKGTNLPDPELVFEQLLRRPEGKFREHPSGLNRLFFSFATIVIHECFQTNRKNPWINETSHYVDLSTLYGNTEKDQEKVRTFNNGFIYPDSIASERIMLMPPGVVATLIMFSRNHNTIVQNLLSVNEQGLYRDWNSLSEEKQKWQDNDLFQLARNINVGFFATVVLKDYVAAILNTPRANSTWSLDLGKEIKSVGQRVERGTGNVVSCEFAVLYHWHAALSAADASWMEDLIKGNLPEVKSLDDMTPELFGKILMIQGHKLVESPAKEWTFNGLKRGADGRFDDTEIAELLKDCVEEPAHAFGAHGTPASLKVVDIMGQLQAREMFNVCTMNEFRSYLNLKPYESFEDWCEDKETARAAELLYSHIDNLELYPGLMAECTKPAIPGSGVCPGQTTGRGILDDAVALVRGDRFLSYDFNSTTLTNWGVSKVTDIPGGAYGGMLPKLIFNGLPTSFTGTSSYALLPFYTPKAVQSILKDNKVIDQYDITRPAKSIAPAAVHTYAGCKAAFADLDVFSNPYKLSAWDTPSSHSAAQNTAQKLAERRIALQQIFFDDNFETKLTTYFREKTAEQIKLCSLKYNSARRSVDIIRDITNVVPVTWLATRLALPIKSQKTPHGLLSVPELFNAFHAIHRYQSFDLLAIDQWQLRSAANAAGPTLKKILETHLKTQQGFKEKLVDWMAKDSAFEVGPDADRFYHALNATKLPADALASDTLRLTAPIAAVLSHQAALLIDLYLSPSYAPHLARLIELAHAPASDAAAARELQGYVFEGLRHAGAVPGALRTATRATSIPDGARGSVPVAAHQTLFVATAAAAMDPVAFPAPETIDPQRPVESYALLTQDLHLCEGARVVGPALAAILGAVFALKNVRRAKGMHGRLVSLERDVAGVKTRHYLDGNAREVAVPVSLNLEYEV